MRRGYGRHPNMSYLDSEQEASVYILIVLDFGPVFGQSWAQERAQRPRLEKRYTNQRKLPREIGSKVHGRPPTIKGIPKYFVGQVVFWTPGVPGPKKGTCFRKIIVSWPCPKSTLFLKMCGCLALALQASKKSLGQKTLRDPSDISMLGAV